MPNKKEKPKKWVVMIYSVASDKNSEEGMTNFFKELNEVGKEIDKKGSKSELKILLQAYRNWGTNPMRGYYAKRFDIKNNFLEKGRIPPDVIYTPLYTNMGDPNALSDFIFWCKDNYPADHYLLLLWGHGAQYGMFTGTIDKANKKLSEPVLPRKFTMTLNGGNENLSINQLRRARKAIPNQFSEMQELMITYKKPDEKGLAETDKISRKIINGWPKIPPTVIYYFDVDNNDRFQKLKELIPSRPIDDSLTIEEICKSLWDTGQYVRGFGNIEILLIFGCGMQTFELAYELSKCKSLYCKYLVASEELIYWEGYNYKDSFLRLLNNPGMDARTLSKYIVSDTEHKRPDKKNPNDGHRDKATWAISCIDIGKCAKAARIVNNIAAKILEFPGGNSSRNMERSLKRNWTKGYSEALFLARVHCHHFGEDAFRACYIDLTWFLKKIKGFLEQNSFLNENVLPGSAALYSKHKRLIKELAKAILFFERDFVVEPWIGEKRSEKAEWQKMIIRRPEKGKRVKSSTGAHGISMFFPFSDNVQVADKIQKLFFESNSDYNLEFVKNKFEKKKFVKSRDSWNLLVQKYTSVNVQTDYRFIRNGKLSPGEKNTEPN